MSELQLGLILIGVLVVAGVLLYNRTQERKAQLATDAALHSKHADVLMGGAESSPGKSSRAPGRRDAVSQESLPDPRLDYVIELSAGSSRPARAIIEQWDALARRFRDRVLVAGCAGGSDWRPLSPGDAASYERLRAGLQLVARAGVTGEADLIEYRSEVENLAAQLGFHANAPEMKAALDAAREIDAFCADRDIQVALHVVSRTTDGFDRAQVLSIAERFGLALEEHGRLSCLDGSGRALFEAADRSGARLDVAAAAAPLLALSLTMDVPRTPDTRRSFEAMARLAASLAADLGGAIVDDNGNVLDERALGAIEAELVRIGGELEARGFPPGGALALRLFS